MNRIYYAVDRIEEGIVVAQGEDERFVSFSLMQFTDTENPPTEGDCFWIDEAGNCIIDAEETERRRAEARALLESLLRRKQD